MNYRQKLITKYADELKNAKATGLLTKSTDWLQVSSPKA